jgi:pyruvate dehydrogenase E2 component (dihydrolipoamide acetyltransferase)
MAKVLEMPKLSPTMEEGVLTAWHKAEGDPIAVDDLLAEVETDKATMEFRAFDKGTLLKLLVPAGANVKLGQPVAIVGNPGEDITALVAQHGQAGGASKAQAPSPPQPPPQTPTVQPTPSPRPPDTEAPRAVRAPARTTSVLDRTAHVAEPVTAPENGRVLASPYVRRVAREMGVDLRGAHGSGPGGRVVQEDLQRMKAAPPRHDGEADTTSRSVAQFAEGDARNRQMVRADLATLQPTATNLAEPEVRPLSMMRKTIARRLTEAKQTVPHFYLNIDVDASALVQLRERLNQELADQDGESAQKLSLNDFIVKGCALALLRVPECNASFTPDAILIHKRVDISVAVAIPDGLVTPVVRNADQKSLAAIGREVRDLATRARGKKLKPEEMQNGTFSISNLGMFGIDEFAAVINPPEGAILAVGRVRDEPVVKNGAVEPGKRLAMTLSCDHRVVDGAVGAAFLAELRGLLERPMRLLTG